jgi:hypothetical protein
VAAPVKANVMCVMAQNQDHRGRSQLVSQRQVLQFSGAGCSGLVPSNKKSAGAVTVAFSPAPQAVSIGAAGSDGGIAIPAAGFGRALGGVSRKIRAAHITNRSSSFRPSASTGRG